MTTAEQSVAQFMDRLASDSPTPGGGSVAALGGALAASLAGMAARLTLGRDRYREVRNVPRNPPDIAHHASGNTLVGDLYTHRLNPAWPAGPFLILKAEAIRNERQGQTS